MESRATGSLYPLRPKSDSELSREPLQSVVRRLGSTRTFDRARSLSFGDLSTLLGRATRGISADFLDPPSASLLDLYLIVHAVEGLPAGAYHYRRQEQSLEEQSSAAES